MDISKVIRDNCIDKYRVFKIKNKKILVAKDKKHRPYFRLRDISNLLGYKDHRSFSSRIDKTYRIEYKKIKSYNTLKIHPQTIFVTGSILVRIMSKCNMIGVDKIIKCMGITNKYRYKRKEVEIIDELDDFFNEINTERKCQFKTGKYIIDMYIPKYKLAIEIDEHGHRGRNKEYEKNRTEIISNKLKCQFIRCNPDSPNFSITKLIGKITNYIVNYCE